MNGYCVYEIYKLDSKPNLKEIETKCGTIFSRLQQNCLVFMPSTQENFDSIGNAAFIFKKSARGSAPIFHVYMVGPQVILGRNYARFLRKIFVDDPSSLLVHFGLEKKKQFKVFSSGAQINRNTFVFFLQVEFEQNIRGKFGFKKFEDFFNMRFGVWRNLGKAYNLFYFLCKNILRLIYLEQDIN